MVNMNHAISQGSSKTLTNNFFEKIDNQCLLLELQLFRA